MRLGDLDALKEAINSEIEQATEVGIAVDTDYLWSLLNYAIDNAPTIETPTIYEFKGCDNCELERPQGEWIDTGDMQEYWAEEYQCSICEAKDHWHNYCPNCGAKMKGGEEE